MGRGVRILRRAGVLALAASWQLLLAGVACAADAKEGASEGGKPYYVLYFLVIVFILLGLAAVCRPVSRKREGEDHSFGAFIPDVSSGSDDAKKG